MLYELLLIGEWVWNIPLLIGLAVFSMVYLYFLKLLPDSTAFRKQTLFFFFTLAILYFCIGSPFTQFSQLSFSLHMVQMSILYFIVPPLLLLGIPYPLYQRVIKLSFVKKARQLASLNRRSVMGSCTYTDFLKIAATPRYLFAAILYFPAISVKKISRLLLPWMVSLILFAVLFTSYHLPVVLNFTSQHVFLQTSYSFLMFALSFSMWWPLTAPDPKQRLKGKRLKRFALLSGLILMPACLLLILNVFSSQIHNPYLAQMTAHICIPLETSSIDILPPFFNSKLDQFISGVLMLLIHKFSIMTFIRMGSRHSEEFRQSLKTKFREVRKIQYKA